MEDHDRDLTRDDLAALPETRLAPGGARLVSSTAAGTGEGCGFDNLDPSASSDRYFEGPVGFEEVVAWYRGRFAELGWSSDIPVTNASGTRWHRWLRGRETIDLIDRVIAPDDAIARVGPTGRGGRLTVELPCCWSRWSITYMRPPVADGSAGRRR